jgi:ABC-2 type transport system permease protein
MNARRYWAVARKETLHVLRDPRSLAMAVAMPMAMLLLYGFALTLDVDNVAIILWDRSGTPQSRELISRFEGSRYFRVAGRAAGHADIERAIDRREAMLALVIPEDYARAVESGRRAEVQLIVDGSDAGTATLALGYAESVVGALSQEVLARHIRRAGGAPSAPPVDLRPRVWFNPDLESRNFIVPGLIAVIMMVIAALITSLTVAREWERGTMEQLISTPVTPAELVLGKLTPYFAVGMLDITLSVLMGEFVFHVPLRGSAPLLFLMAAIFLAGVLALGAWISVITRNQLLACQLAMVLTFLPAFLLSGYLFAISNMPAPVQAVTYAIPARYFVSLLKGIYLKGVGLETLGFEAALLAAFTAGMIALTISSFRRKLD